MKIIFSALILLFLYSCNSVDSNSNEKFSIQTEKSSYKLNSTTSISITFTNNLGREVKIYNSSCGCPKYIIEKYEEKNWSLFRELPICERLPDEPIRVADGRHVILNLNITIMQIIESGFYRMKFDIKAGSDNITIEDKYLYSNQFSFEQ